MKRGLIPATPLFLTACTAQKTGEHIYLSWAGKWTGVEGTYLNITPEAGKYQIEIRDLDRSRFFTGENREHGIRFIRDGKTETLRAGNGKDTGMKWLADKKRCLVIRMGEGYCRD